MARRRYSRKKVPGDSGTVYILEIMLEQFTVYKIGVTTRSVAKRALQIIEGIYKMYGYFPEVRIIREDKTKNHFKVETRLHNLFVDNKYDPEFAFTGSTELFIGVTLDEVCDEYRKLITEDEDPIDDERLAVW